MKYSIIVPVYKAEKYLSKCVDSLLHNVPSETEIILVNDGSPDNCGDICLSYKNKYSQIVYIDKENGGVSSARNAGIEVATGKYIMFVDSDDWVVDDFYNILEDVTNRYDCDFIMFSHRCVNRDLKKNKIAKPFLSLKFSAVTKKLSSEICKSTVNPPWAKLYKRKIIIDNNIRFSTAHNLGEDLLFNVEYALYVNSFAVDSRVVYCFNTENSDSLSRKVPDIKHNHSTSFNECIDDVLKNSHTDIKRRDAFQRVSNFCRIRRVYTVAKRLHRQGLNKEQRRTELLTLCKNTSENSKNVPKNLYSLGLALPVRLKLVSFLDLFAAALNRLNR